MTLDDDSKKDDSKKSHSVCAFATTGNFTKLVLGMLSDSLKADLEHHAIEENCEACKKTWFDVSEIASGINKPTDQELTLILRIFSGKIWHNKEEKLIARVIADIDKKEEEKDAKLSQTEELNSQKIEIIGQRVSTLEIGQTALTSDIKSISYRLTALIVAIFAITFTLFAILLVKNEYVKNSPDSSSLPMTTVPISSTVSATTSHTTNLYQQLDLAIDNYLNTNNKSHLEQADIFANQIQEQYQDNYGIDLVAYYKSVETKDFGKLAYLRQEVKELDKAPFSANETDSYLARAQKTEEALLILGNILESYRAKYLLANRYLLIGNTAYESILDNGITYSESNGYLFLKVYFLVSKAKSEANDPDELQAKGRLEGTFALSKQLQLNDIIPTIAMSLSGVCQKYGENKKALEMSEDALKIPAAKHTTTISLMHVAGMASFALGDYDKSDKYFQDAIVLAQQHNNSIYLSISYSLAGSLATAKGDFSESQNLLEKAEKVASAVTDEHSKARLMFNIKGHEAKLGLKQGKYLEASLFYKASLSNLDIVGTRSNLIQASELNEGLALALESTNTKDSRHYHTVADYFFRQAGGKKQANCLISFLPRQCN